jgi:putative ABC transport system permease protein
MCKKNLIAALKALSVNKLSTFLNIMGLSIGITCVLLAILFVQHELSIDRFHQKINNIYRLLIAGESRSRNHALEYHSDIIQSRARVLKKFPEIKRVVRMVPERGKIKYKDTWIREHRFWLTDPNIFDMLTLPLRYGDSKTVLQTPNSVVITPAMALKYFGNDNPIGKTFNIQFSIIPVQYTFRVTGILEPLPTTSSIQIDFLAHIPFERLIKDRREMSGNLSEWIYVMTLLELVDASAYPSLQEKLSHIHCHDAYKYMRLENMTYRLEPLKQAYLKSKATFSAPFYTDFTKAKGDVRLLIMVAVLSFAALLASCLNPINFSPEPASQRSEEDVQSKGERTIRKRLSTQLITKIVVMSGLSILLSLVLLETTLPLYSSIFDRELSVNYSTN